MFCLSRSALDFIRLLPAETMLLLKNGRVICENRSRMSASSCFIQIPRFPSLFFVTDLYEFDPRTAVIEGILVVTGTFPLINEKSSRFDSLP